MNRHTVGELAQMQRLPLKYKIELTKQRIEAWYNSWTQFEIYDKETGKTRYATIDTREYGAEPEMKPSEYINRENRGHVYLSFSGGKDSTVLKHIIDSMYEDVPAVFVNTGLEYPEIQHFVRDIKRGKYPCFNSNVEILRPEMRFDEVLRKYGYPVISKEVSDTINGARKSIEKGVYSFRLCKLGVKRDEYGGLYDDGAFDYDGALAGSKFRCPKWRFLLDAPFKCSSYCCDAMKKKPAAEYEKRTGRRPIIATLATESTNRKNNWLRNGCNAFFTTKPKSTPISFWTEQDILHYLVKYDVPYCSVYGDIIGDFGELDGQITVADYTRKYDISDKLKTTGCNRTGCIFCMFGCHREKAPNRFQRLKETHPRQYEYCIGGGEYNEAGKWQPNKEGLGLGKVLDYIGVEYK